MMVVEAGLRKEKQKNAFVEGSKFIKGRKRKPEECRVQKAFILFIL